MPLNVCHRMGRKFMACSAYRGFKFLRDAGVELRPDFDRRLELVEDLEVRLVELSKVSRGSGWRVGTLPACVKPANHAHVRLRLCLSTQVRGRCFVLGVSRKEYGHRRRTGQLPSYEEGEEKGAGGKGKRVYFASEMFYGSEHLGDRFEAVSGVRGTYTNEPVKLLGGGAGLLGDREGEEAEERGVLLDNRVERPD